MNFKIVGKSLTLVGIALFLVYLIAAAYYSSLSLSNVLILNDGSFRAVITGLSLATMVISYFVFLAEYNVQLHNPSVRVQRGGATISKESVEAINEAVNEHNRKLAPDASPFQVVINSNKDKSEYTIQFDRSP